MSWSQVPSGKAAKAALGKNKVHPANPEKGAFPLEEPATQTSSDQLPPLVAGKTGQQVGLAGGDGCKAGGWVGRHTDDDGEDDTMGGMAAAAAAQNVRPPVLDSAGEPGYWLENSRGGDEYMLSEGEGASSGTSSSQQVGAASTHEAALAAVDEEMAEQAGAVPTEPSSGAVEGASWMSQVSTAIICESP